MLVRLGRGLSPLARGNHNSAEITKYLQGPIPARAGEPGWCWRCSCRRRAYPRSRGGTHHPPAATPPPLGLSPLARGNQASAPWCAPWSRPIPARAGEPELARHRLGFQGAYPRSRGGTPPWPRCTGRRHGLSPLARGNQGSGAHRVGAGGPIPARAGEPNASANIQPLGRAYPRSRGGTTSCTACMTAAKGLSPLARGNLSHLTC